jgi:hypothetical protein
MRRPASYEVVTRLTLIGGDISELSVSVSAVIPVAVKDRLAIRWQID